MAEMAENWEIPYLGNITSSDARIWNSMEIARFSSLYLINWCRCIDDIWHYPSFSVILVFLRVAELKYDTPVGGQYFNQ